MQWGLWQLWSSWNIKPLTIVGFGPHEWVAAAAAGVVEIEDTILVMQSLGRLATSAAETRELWALPNAESTPWKSAVLASQDAQIAADYGPAGVVLSVLKGRLDAVFSSLQDSNPRGIRIANSVIWPLTREDTSDYANIVSKLSYRRPQIKLVSGSQGRVVESEQLAHPDYWTKQALQPTRFGTVTKALDELGCQAVVQVGAGSELVAFGRQFRCPAFWLSSLQEDASCWTSLLKSLATLYVLGIEVDWREVEKPYWRCKVSLPPYAFDRERYWHEGANRQPNSVHEPKVHPLLGSRRASAGQEIVFETWLSPQHPAYLQEHSVYGVCVFPAAGIRRNGTCCGKAAIRKQSPYYCAIGDSAAASSL